VEGTSFVSGSRPKGSKLVNNIFEHKNKIVTSDVDTTVVLVEAKIIKRNV